MGSRRSSTPRLKPWIGSHALAEQQGDCPVRKGKVEGAKGKVKLLGQYPRALEISPLRSSLSGRVTDKARVQNDDEVVAIRRMWALRTCGLAEARANEADLASNGKLQVDTLR
ncbi:MAG: hypothetical protein AAGF11_18285 [Myxococcota bacterium]